MSAVAAPVRDFSCFDLRSACVRNNARDYYQFSDEVALELSEHPGYLVGVDLDLELGALVARLEVLLEVVRPVHLLHRLLKLQTTHHQQTSF
jgi:hypothetical protein